MPKSQRHWFIDTVVLSNFAFAEMASILIQRYGKNLKIPDEVHQEIVQGVNEGYNSLDRIVNLIDKGSLETISLTANEKKEYFVLLCNLGPGEAACIAAAANRRGTVISDDRLAKTVCQEKGIPVTGSIGILKACYLDQTIDLNQADTILKKMVENGFYSPVRSITDIL